jgi:hypothetical protein
MERVGIDDGIIPKSRAMRSGLIVLVAAPLFVSVVSGAADNGAIEGDAGVVGWFVAVSS